MENEERSRSTHAWHLYYTYSLYIDTIRGNESARAYEPSCSWNSAAPYDQVLSLIDISIYKNP